MSMPKNVRPLRTLAAVVILGGALTFWAGAQQGGGSEIAGYVPAPAEGGGPAASSIRIMVLLNTPVTDAIIAELATYGQVHGWLDRYRLVAMTPKRDARPRIMELPYVDSVENDKLRYTTDVGTWDRDLLDITDVEESGVIGEPDRREIAETGAGITVAVIDTGLIENWRDFLIETRVRTFLARAFMGGGAVAEDFVPPNEFHTSNPTNLWERDTNSHGTAVASHIIGFKIRGLVVDGAAPGSTVIPIKVFPNGEAFTWSSRIIAAFDYVTRLREAGVIGPTVISMSVGGGSPVRLEERAINDAIAAGIVVVTSAGNRGERGMGWPGAFPQVIGVGAVGWTRQFQPGTLAAPNIPFWWTQDVGFDPDRPNGSSEEVEAFVAGFSSRAIPALRQQLDVLGPGQWTVAPGGHGPNAAFFFWAGTSFSTPLTAGVAALMLEKNPALTQSDVESIMKSTALPMSPVDSRSGVLEPFIAGGVITVSWDDDCNGVPCDPVGAGLLQADDALVATPRAPRR